MKRPPKHWKSGQLLWHVKLHRLARYQTWMDGENRTIILVVPMEEGITDPGLMVEYWSLTDCEARYEAGENFLEVVK